MAKNFAYSTVLTAPSPASSGTSLVVQSGNGALFPTEPFMATIWPAGVQPLTTNAEVILVSSIATDTFTIVRAQESSSARTVVVGDQIAATNTIGVWRIWTPSWTNLTVGNGTVVARYTQIGNTVIARVSLVWGSTTSIAGDVSFSLPVTRATYAGTADLTQIGGVQGFDVSGARAYPFIVVAATTTTAKIKIQVTDLTYLYNLNLSSTTPFTWTTSDEISGTFTYEVA